jgi:hypothetical protein
MKAKMYKPGTPQYEAWFNQKEPDYVEIDGKWEKAVTVDGKTFAVLGFDHLNGHLSGFTDRYAIFGIKMREIEN